MARFDNRQIDEIRQRTDIAEVVGRHVTLKRSGRNYIGLCPFHEEKTPSFHVHQARQFFHCFGCKESGDVFAFLMKIERTTFPEALERLAQESGVELKTREPSPEARRRQSEQDRIYEINQMAARYFHRSLTDHAGQDARSYLEKRGIGWQTVKRFGLGYARPGWRNLLAALQSQGVEASEVVRAGLAVRRDGKPPFDMFRHRLIFPILDVRGRVVAFGGRALDPEERAKYINTPQTPVYSKGDHLFGLCQARDAARRAGMLILCEGYTDVTALSQAGIDNAAASLGTAFTFEQAELVGRWAKEVVLAFDADAAGQAAAAQGLDQLDQVGLRVRVAVLPDGEDPDSLVRNRGLQAFQDVLGSALSLTDYKIEGAFRAGDVNDMEGRLAIVQAVLPILAGLESPVALEAYVDLVAQRLGTSQSALTAELRRFQSKSGMRRNSRHRKSVTRHTKTDSAKHPRGGANSGRVAGLENTRTRQLSERTLVRDEQRLLYILLKDPAKVKLIETELGPEPFEVARHNRLYQVIKRRAQGDHDILVHEVPELAKALEKLEAWNPVLLPDIGTYIQRVWEWRIRIRLQRLEVELARLSERDENAYAENVGSLLLEYRRLRQAVRGRDDQRTVS